MFIRITIFLFSMVLVSQTAFTSEYNNLAPVFLPKDQILTYARFVEILNTKKPKSVKATLKLIKERFPRFLDFYVLSYDSPSAQNSSFQHPRAIVFGHDAKLVITFNGSPNQAGYEALEVMFFDDSSKTFNFQSIVFTDDLKKRQNVGYSKDVGWTRPIKPSSVYGLPFAESISKA